MSTHNAGLVWGRRTLLLCIYIALCSREGSRLDNTQGKHRNLWISSIRLCLPCMLFTFVQFHFIIIQSRIAEYPVALRSTIHTFQSFYWQMGRPGQGAVETYRPRPCCGGALRGTFKGTFPRTRENNSPGTNHRHQLIDMSLVTCLDPLDRQNNSRHCPRYY